MLSYEKKSGNPDRGSNWVSEMKYRDLTHKIIGCAMEVHRVLGCGFQEVIYQRALAIELGLQGIDHKREEPTSIYYKQHHIGRRRVDFYVSGKVLVELKAVSDLDNAHLAQALNYLEAFNMEVGLLINFGARSLQYKRVLNTKIARIRRI